MSTYTSELNVLKEIDWQRSNASVLIDLLNDQQEWINVNHNQFWDSFLTDIFDLRTANKFGLSVWSIILNEPLYGVTQASPADYPAWGYGANRKNYGNGNYGTNSDSGYNFTLEQGRIVLLLKAFSLHMSGSVHGDGVLGINEALDRIFGSGKIYCLDNRDMTFTYYVQDESILSITLELYARDLLPRPVGIGIGIIYNANAKSFGFSETHYAFGGNFYSGVIKEE